MSDTTIRTRGATTGIPTKRTPLDYEAIESQVSFLQGKVLTVIDAAILDERQLKATKDLIKSAFSEQLSWIGQLCFPEVVMASRDEMTAKGEDVEKIEREAETLA
jgi:hypothetical protein